MKNLKIHGCLSCPFISTDIEGFNCFIKEHKFIKKEYFLESNFSNYPDWCPLIKHSFVIHLNK